MVHGLIAICRIPRATAGGLRVFGNESRPNVARGVCCSSSDLSLARWPSLVGLSEMKAPFRRRMSRNLLQRITWIPKDRSSSAIRSAGRLQQPTVRRHRCPVQSRWARGLRLLLSSWTFVNAILPTLKARSDRCGCLGCVRKRGG